MPMSPADIEALIAELHRDPQLRDRVRDAILGADFLALPGIVARLGERIEELTAIVGRLEERMEKLEARVDTMAAALTDLLRVVQLHDGRLGNIEGRLFELDYRDRLPARLGRRYLKVRGVHIPDIDRVSRAFASREIDQADWDDLLQIDAAAWGRRLAADRTTEPTDVLIVLELSRTVNAEDVRRIHRRAEILRRLGLDVDAGVDGEQIRPEAIDLADSLGVVRLVVRDASAA